MSLTIQMQAIGAPEVLVAVDVDVPPPGPCQVQVRQTAIGVNFIDIYHRIGLYPLPHLPAVIGVEGAGVVEAVGPEVSGIEVGDRVAYAGLPPGAYAERRNLPDARVVKIPERISDRVAGSAMLRGLTAHMLLHKVYSIQPGDFVLVHAAAGGLGQFLTRWAKRLGATVIATVGSEAKIGPAEAAGADLVVLHTASDWTDTVKRASGGLGVHLACDGIGGEMLARTFASVRPFGVVASVGQAAGPVPAVDVSQLGPVRCISLSRPSVIAYANDATLYRPAAADLFAVLTDGLPSNIGGEYSLREAARAHSDLEGGRTTGSLILLP
ncbi:alcohol dehydrogenase [Bradyrhizobium sp. NAS80.1]|uniref:quinone oxidoreductase family protein n=1 Tax=Bradyrhizobium sp. NAS80.1 TaxID=1680159 RepID=UPI00095E96FD|nr:quinone oxidoreductase [Bradyrhizobium sp. NAS80.1]OKO91506.1 alcohol dehydrogenase [Bradyrhizobium sp. NAS80.1]